MAHQRPAEPDPTPESARAAERAVHDWLKAAVPRVRRVAVFAEQRETPDFEFEFEGGRVGVEVKTKLHRYSQAYQELWPELDERNLFILDESSLRSLMWPDGLGYLLIHDHPVGRWVAMGPWELLLGPRRRFEGPVGDDEAARTKGKLLLDLATGVEMAHLDLDRFLELVRTTRRHRHQARPIRMRGQQPLPTVPAAPAAHLSGGARAPVPDVSAVSEAAEVPDVAPPANGVREEVEPSTAWCGLDARLAVALSERFGWDEPTAIQRAAISPILSGHNTLVTAPTAGGKTEAGLLPLLDLARRGAWRPLSIVVVSPMKALLDDQLRRYQELGRLTGATAFAWHGDTSWNQRREFLGDPSDVLLTTPESLEILLHSADARKALAGARAVLVDEVHAFVGTSRGAQLAALLERLNERCDADLQRVGLSATVGQPEEALAWLAGSSYWPRSMASAPGQKVQEETSIVSYDDNAKLLATLRAVVAEQRTLVFVPSRRKAEDVAAGLGLPVHHSSVSAEGRAVAVERFRRGDVAGLVATATLELGIDIGDVELVVQDRAPSSPASYLQRVGRSGRRSGLRRMLFTCDSGDDLLQVLAVLARVRRAALGEAPARRGARLVLGQQAIALALEPMRVGMERHDLAAEICHSPVFRGLEADAERTLDHLVSGGWLLDLGGRLICGPRTMDEFGGRAGFLNLAVSFDSRSSVLVVDDTGRVVGTVDWEQAKDDGKIAGGAPFRLQGKAWRAVAVTGQTVRVVPEEGSVPARAPSWRGRSLDVDRATWETVREILASTEVPAALDARAREWLEIERIQWAPALERPVRCSRSGVAVATFAGAAVHRAVLAVLGLEGSSDGPDLRIACSDEAGIRDRACSALARFDEVMAEEARRMAGALVFRHRNLVPESVLVAEAAEFHVDRDGIRQVLDVLAEDSSWPS